MLTIKNLNFIKTCDCCPEQYDVLNQDDEQVGYVRLRYGFLRCDYPNVGGETIYTYDFEDDYLGQFPDADREKHLNIIADKIIEKINMV